MLHKCCLQSTNMFAHRVISWFHCGDFARVLFLPGFCWMALIACFWLHVSDCMFPTVCFWLHVSDCMFLIAWFWLHVFDCTFLIACLPAILFTFFGVLFLCLKHGQCARSPISIESWHPVWHSFWHIFWHSFWHISWHSVWHSFWHIFWHSFSHISWNSGRHSFWHIVWRSFWNSFWHISWHSVWHSFWHSIWHSFSHSISRLRSGREHWAQMVAVEVRQGTLGTAGRSWGPAWTDIAAGGSELTARRQGGVCEGEGREGGGGGQGWHKISQPSPDGWGINKIKDYFISKIKQQFKYSLVEVSSEICLVGISLQKMVETCLQRFLSETVLSAFLVEKASSEILWLICFALFSRKISLERHFLV